MSDETRHDVPQMGDVPEVDEVDDYARAGNPQCKAVDGVWHCTRSAGHAPEDAMHYTADWSSSTESFFNQHMGDLEFGVAKSLTHPNIVHRWSS